MSDLNQAERNPTAAEHQAEADQQSVLSFSKNKLQRWKETFSLYLFAPRLLPQNQTPPFPLMETSFSYLSFST